MWTFLKYPLYIIISLLFGIIISCEKEIINNNNEKLSYYNSDDSSYSHEKPHYEFDMKITYHGLNDSLDVSIYDLACSTSDSLKITISPQNNPASSYHYEWSHTDNSVNQLVVRDNRDYTIVVSEDSNNYAVVSLELTDYYSSSRCYVIPTAFSPNNDGVNDVWEIPGLNNLYPSCQIDVFTESGVRVFKSTGYNKPWDGTYKGKKLAAGDYYFKIDLSQGSEDYFLTGSVTIIY